MASLIKQLITRWVDRKGRRLPAGTKGARKVTACLKAYAAAEG
jgi:hypothetical protein